MPTGADRLVDTSVAVALVVEGHEHHEDVWKALLGETLGLAGHAAFETYSVLTRLPPPARRHPAQVAGLLATNFPFVAHLSADGTAALLAELAGLGIAGGAVYDALVGAAAVEHGRRLVTRDRRALPVYQRLGVEVDVL